MPSLCKAQAELLDLQGVFEGLETLEHINNCPPLPRQVCNPFPPQALTLSAWPAAVVAPTTWWRAGAGPSPP